MRIRPRLWLICSVNNGLDRITYTSHIHMNSVNKNSGDLRGLSPFGAVIADYHGVPKREAVFEALWEFLKSVPFYRNHFSIEQSQLWAVFVHSGVDKKQFLEVLLPLSRSVNLGFGEDYEPEEDYYYIPEAGFLWEDWRDLFFHIQDREKAEMFFKKNRARNYEVCLPDIQKYQGFVFDFVRDEIQRDGRAVARIGEKSSKLAKIILAQRGRKFEYWELAEMLGESAICNDWRSSFNYKRSLDKIFERFNRKLGAKIFHFAKDCVFVEV